MVFELVLPKSGISEPRGALETMETLVIENGNSVVLVGANGSGKTRLAYFLSTLVGPMGWQAESLLNNQVFRTVTISAQRVLSVTHVQPRNNPEAMRSQLYSRLGAGNSLLSGENQFADIFSLLISEEFEASTVSRDALKNYHSQGIPPPQIEKTRLDHVREIWDSVLHPRKLSQKLSTGTLAVIDEHGNSYELEGLSDGEKIAFYLIGKCVAAPSDRVLIIDEPEIHLHRSILSALWDKLEAVRNDCLFVYLTHDVEFAASRVNAKKIWIESFDGNAVWTWHEIPSNESLPQELLLKLLGNRKPVLFIEGELNSLDFVIYQACYPDFKVIPVSGSYNVFKCTRALRDLYALHHFEVFGLVDRDYKSDAIIESLVKNHIYTTQLAEIENLFLVPEAIEIMARQLLIEDPKQVVSQIIQYVFERLKKDLQNQVRSKVLDKLREQLSAFHSPQNTPEGMRTDFDKYVSSIDIEASFAESQAEFDEVLAKRDYAKALQVFNRKDLLTGIDHFFGLRSGNYQDRFLYLIKNATSEQGGQDLIVTLRRYLPNIRSPM